MSLRDPTNSRARLRKERAGLYEHVASGRLIVRTGGWEGPRGGRMDLWEYAYREGDNICIDGIDRFRSLRAAVEAIA